MQQTHHMNKAQPPPAAATPPTPTQKQPLSSKEEGKGLIKDFIPKYGIPPDEVFCPITTEIMRDPVLAADGHTYERSAIESWFEKKRRANEQLTSPKTNVVISDTLMPNHSLKR